MTERWGVKFCRNELLVRNDVGVPSCKGHPTEFTGTAGGDGQAQSRPQSYEAIVEINLSRCLVQMSLTVR